VFVAGRQSGLDQILTPAFMRIRWTLSKKMTILILSFIGIGAIIYNYLMQFKDMKFNDFYDDEEDTDLFDRN
jgi:hypothetical protein